MSVDHIRSLKDLPKNQGSSNGSNKCFTLHQLTIKVYRYLISHVTKKALVSYLYYTPLQMKTTKNRPKRYK